MSKNPQDLGHEQRMSTEMQGKILVTAASITFHLNCHLRSNLLTQETVTHKNKEEPNFSLCFPAQNAVSETQEVLREDLPAM